MDKDDKSESSGAVNKAAPPSEISGPHKAGCKGMPSELGKCGHNGTYNVLAPGKDMSGGCPG